VDGEVGQPIKLAGGGLMGAIEREAARSDQPVKRRLEVLARIAGSPMCYPIPMTQDQADAQMLSNLRAPSEPQGGGFGPRFFTVTRCWVGAAQIGDSGRSQPTQLTYSFPDDGTTWGLTCTIYGTGLNDLGAKLTTQFGSLDRGREMMRSSLAAWRYPIPARLPRTNARCLCSASAVGDTV